MLKHFCTRSVIKWDGPYLQETKTGGGKDKLKYQLKTINGIFFKLINGIYKNVQLISYLTMFLEMWIKAEMLAFTTPIYNVLKVSIIAIKTRKINKIHKDQKGRHINDPIWLDNATYPKSPREAKKQFIKLTYEFRKSLDTELICKTQLFSYILKAKNWR